MSGPLEDSALSGYVTFFRQRAARAEAEIDRIVRAYGSLRAYAGLHDVLGLHRDDDGAWIMREWLPAAVEVWVTTDRIGFSIRDEFAFYRQDDGVWACRLPGHALAHGDYYELRVRGLHGGIVKRVPAFADHVVQDASDPNQWCARCFHPDNPYRFTTDPPRVETDFIRIYEAHVGMALDASEHRASRRVGTYAAFAESVLPRIKRDGYTAVQLMAVPEHPLYKSFGYQVANYFAPSHRYGTPDDFRALVDRAHELGLIVILDIVHSHAASNTDDGIASYDTSSYFFKDTLNQWGTPSFDYGKEMARRFLLSNCRYWMESYRIDGFRFDAVGNILYADHGIDDDFSHVGRCFYGKDGRPRADRHGETYLCLANALIHELNPHAVTIAEEFSGMPGLTRPPSEGGLGFDYRLAMGLPDYWGKFIQQGPSTMGRMWYELTNHRPYDRTVSYVECHDQCINGDDAMIWRMLGDAMYTRMSPSTATWRETRGVAIYKLMRAVTALSADAGFMNFMGSEFGHPEWLDDDGHAHRQWSLADDDSLLYSGIGRWDKAIMTEVIGRHGSDFASPPIFRAIHDDHRLLAFERGRMLMAFNFHETRSETSFVIPATPGKYLEVLSSDESRFYGNGNLDRAVPPTEHFSDPRSGIDPQDVTIYLPAMTALVLRRV